MGNQACASGIGKTEMDARVEHSHCSIGILVRGNKGMMDVKQNNKTILCLEVIIAGTPLISEGFR